jgi:LacI family transcriptional regulator
MNDSSIVDVARLAGVSKTTVSRIINNVDYPIAAKTREKVLKAIEELQFSPNKAAQQLKNNSSDIIGLIVRDISDPLFGEVAKGVTERASQLGYLSFVCNTGRNPEDELRYHDLLWQHRVKGIILAGGGLNEPGYKRKLSEQIERHDKYGLKIVTLAPQGVEIPYVMINNQEAGKKVTEYLVNRGHKKIGFIAGPEKVFTSLERLQGYKHVLKSNGLDYCNDFVSYSDYSYSGGYEACKELINRMKDMTAICCANDNIALGAMSVLKEHGFNIPEDISVISIGDFNTAKYADPPLTTLAIPYYDIGQMAVDVIVEGKEDARFILDTHMMERKSVKDI